MENRRNGDILAVAAIVAGIVAGARFLGPVTFSFGNQDRRAETNARIEEVLATESALSGVPFHASSFTTGFSVQGVYAGTMAYEGDRIRVHVPEASLRRLANRPDDEKLLALRLGLAVGTGDNGWQVISEGAAHPLEDGIGEGEDVRIRDLEMTVPVERSQLCGAWLVVVHELEHRDGTGKLQPAWTYAHSDRLSLAQLVGSGSDCAQP
jgi:hypothetical protein